MSNNYNVSEAFQMEKQNETKIADFHKTFENEKNNINSDITVNTKTPKGQIKCDETGQKDIIAHLNDEVNKFWERNAHVIKIIFVATLFVLYNIYLGFAIRYSVLNGILDVSWCDGVGFLIILTVIVYWSLFYYFILKKYAGNQTERAFSKFTSFLKPLWSRRFVKIGFCALILGGVITFLILDSRGQERRLISAFGLAVVVFMCFLVSKHPRKVVWRHLVWGLALQFTFALAILRWDGGRNALNCISSKVTTFLHVVIAGSSFIYGYLASGSVTAKITFNDTSEVIRSAQIIMPGVFAFKVLSVIYFIGFVISLFYHIGAMTWVVRKLGWLLQITIGTTACESMNAAANIFLGPTEAPMIVKPFLEDMTVSELHAVMTGGFATIAGGAMAAYISFGIDAAYLLSAAVMAAPAALSLAKLVYPETEVSKTTSDHIKQFQTKKDGTLLDAAAEGAVQGITLIGGVISNLIAIISFIHFLNIVISWFGGLVGADYLSFEVILGKLLIPMAWAMGIHWEECEDVALLLGLKIAVNEFIAYERLANRMPHLSDRSRGIATYALCSFANFGCVGIQLGGLGAMAPSRRADLAQAVWRALFTGVAAGLLNGCIAGMLLTATDYGEYNTLNNTSNN